MDIVYSLKSDYNGQELRYSLRSLSNVPHNKVFVVGGIMPDWVNKKEVNNIPFPQKASRYLNTTVNLLKACEDDRVSDDFIYFNDDFFVLEKIANPTEEFNLYNGFLAEKAKGKNNNWHKAMADTAKYLSKFHRIFTPKNYELHTPFIFNKNKLKYILSMFTLDMTALHTCKRSIYGNLYLTDGKNMPDCKVFSHTKEIKAGKFISTSDKGFAVLEDFLKQKFSEKSKYEV